MLGTISHIGIAVRNLDASSHVFESLLGKGPDHTEDLEEDKVRIAIFNLGNSAIELTEALDPQSPIAKFIEKRGEGIHHVSFSVEDIDAELARLKAIGFQLVDERSRSGASGQRVAFLHPKSTNGVLVEISQESVR